MKRAIYLPAISSMMTNLWDKDNEFARKADFINGTGCYTYKNLLISAALVNRTDPNKAKALKNRNADAKLFVDSGGYQIYGGTIDFDFANYDCAKNKRIMQEIFDFQNNYGDYAATFEVGFPLLEKQPELGFTEKDCMDLTQRNLEFWGNQPKHKAVFCNALHGTDTTSAFAWYDAVRDFDFCKGYAFGGGVARNLGVMLKVLLRMLDNGEEPEALHIFGQSSVTYILPVDSIAHALSQIWPNCRVTYDSSTFLQNAVHGKTILGLNYDPRKRTVAFNCVPIGVMTKASHTSTLPVPFKGSIFEGVRMCDWLSTKNESGWEGDSYPILAHNNMEIVIKEQEFLHNLYQVELTQYDADSYIDWADDGKGYLHPDYYHAHNLIQEVLLNRNADLVDKYAHKLNRISVSDANSIDLNNLFTF